MRATLRRSITVGIRAEDVSRRWERRSPLTPYIKQLDAKVIVQPSTKRCYPDAAFASSATIDTDLSAADVILAVKEPALADMVSSGKKQTHVGFWHVHKGQSYNRPRLQAMLETGDRYIDWELLTDEAGNRTTAFGELAVGVCVRLE